MPRPPIKQPPRFSTPLAYHLTLTSMENLYLKSQPAPIHWAVGWADLMMTMFVLFLVMYLYQSTQQRQTADIRQVLSSEKVVQKDPSGSEGDRTAQPEIKSDQRQAKVREICRPPKDIKRKPIPSMVSRIRDKMEMVRLYDLVSPYP